MYIEEIIKATGGRPLNFKNSSIKGIATDSRAVKRGELFIALRGQNFDGHDFVGKAVKKGAIGAIVENQKSKIKNIIIVKDTLKSLGDIAHYHRMKFKIPVIAITGSTGKTTAKEIINCILSQKYKVLKNDGTKNNLIGLPLTLLKLNKSHEICVLEMGANHLGEIKRLAQISNPEIGLITNIGPSHLEFFKSIDNIFKAKCELLDSLKNNCWAVLNKDDNFLRKAKGLYKKIYFGIDNACNIRATHIKEKKDYIKFKINRTSFKLRLFGRHNVYNALGGIAVGQIFGLRLLAISKILERFRNPYDNRLALYKNKDLEILNDTYNANPLSFKAAIDTLKNLGTGKRKIVISADMLELGKKSMYFHKNLGRLIAQSGIDILIAFGPLSRYTSENALRHGMGIHDVMHFSNRRDLIGILPSLLQKGDIVLVKGSRIMHMEEVAEKIKNIRR